MGLHRSAHNFSQRLMTSTFSSRWIPEWYGRRQFFQHLSCILAWCLRGGPTSTTLGIFCAQIGEKRSQRSYRGSKSIGMHLGLEFIRSTQNIPGNLPSTAVCVGIDLRLGSSRKNTKSRYIKHDFLAVSPSL